MKNRIFAIICNVVGIVGWGFLLILGIFDGISMIAVLYGICFICSVISLILNVSQMKKNNCRR